MVKYGIRRRNEGAGLNRSRFGQTPELTEKIKTILTKFSKSRSLSSSLVSRATIIIMAMDGITNIEIGKIVGLHYVHVGKWRQRFLDALPVLKEIESVAPEKLEDAIKGVLSDIRRSGKPRTFTQEQITKIIELACKNPTEFGYEVSQWSLSLLVKEIKKQGIAASISEKSVSRFLKSGRSQAS